MINVKNVRPGMLVIPDAEIALEPGQIHECDKLTRQMEKAISKGHLIKLTGTKLEPQPSTLEDFSTETNLSDLTATEAVSAISKETDIELIKTHLGNEKRRTVLDALAKRQKELASGDN